MILIWGFRARAKTIGDGVFFCPRCGADRQYVRRQIRRWFTLFFIPLAPVGKVLGEQVKCDTCGTCFTLEVLNTPTSDALTTAMTAATRVAAVTMLGAGDRGDAAARAAVIATVRGAGIGDYDDERLTSDLEHGDTSALPAYLAPLAAGLNTQGKERFVAQIARIGLVAGDLVAAQHAVLEQFAASFGLSAAYLQGIIAAAATDAPASGLNPPRDETP